MTLSLILGIVKFGLVALCGLAVFLHLKKSGRNEQILEDKKASDKLQKDINNTKPDTPDESIDKLRNGDF